MDETYLPTRKEALAAGHMFYYTGKMCKHGHIARRYTISETCSTCKLKYVYRPPTAKHREQAKKKYWENPSKVLKSNAKYRDKRRITAPWSVIFNAAKIRSYKRGTEFNLTREWCRVRWTGFCELTGIRFNLEGVKGGLFASPSIDRIDNGRGYLQDNCRFILNCINHFKGRGTDDEMFRIAKILATFSEAS